MTRAEAYILLMHKFKKQKFSYDIKDSGFRGNLAFFIDNCVDCENWHEMYDAIVKYLDNNDLNEACYYISKVVYELAVDDAKKKNYPEVIYRLQRNSIEELYAEKKLEEFQYVPFQCYPDWYYEVSYAYDL